MYIKSIAMQMIKIWKNTASLIILIASDCKGTQTTLPNYRCLPVIYQQQTAHSDAPRLSESHCVAVKNVASVRRR